MKGLDQCRQVPRAQDTAMGKTRPLYGLVGGGRLAKHMSHYMSLLDLPVRTWTRNEIKDKGPLGQYLANCTHIFWLVSDSAIEPLHREHEKLGRYQIHFSGALSLPQVIGVHPLTSFASDNLLSREQYEAIPFILEERSGLNWDFVLGDFPNPRFFIKAKDKAFYHALCVSSGNFTTLLWLDVFKSFEEKLNLPKEILFPYLKRVCENLMTSSSPLTGPLVRGDHETIERNLAALSDHPLKGIYEAFLNRTRNP